MSKTCRNCGANLVDEARFCDRCGTKAANQCSNCCTILGEGDMFCANCGHATGIRKKADPAQYSEKVTVADHLNSDLLNKEEQPTIDKAKDSFKSLWNGDIPLCRAYWLYYVLGGMLIAFLTSILSTLFYEPFILKILNLITLGYAVFAGIGVWRSATKYSGSELWRYLAYIAVILTIIGAVLMFFAYASLLDLLYSY